MIDICAEADMLVGASQTTTVPVHTDEKHEASDAMSRQSDWDVWDDCEE
jgi:hypothetical protein